MQKQTLRIAIWSTGLTLMTAGCVGFDKDWISPPQCSDPRPVYTKARIYRPPMMPDALVSYVVDEHAVVRDVVLKQSSGSDVLDEAAVNAVKEMTCTRPAKDDRGYAWPFGAIKVVKFGFHQ